MGFAGAAFRGGNSTKGYYADPTSSMGIPLLVGTITCGEGVASAWRNPEWIIVMTIPVRVVVLVFSEMCLKCSLIVCSDSLISLAISLLVQPFKRCCTTVVSRAVR